MVAVRNRSYGELVAWLPFLVLAGLLSGCRTAPVPSRSVNPPLYHEMGLAPSVSPSGKYVMFTEFDQTSDAIDQDYLGLFNWQKGQFVSVRRGMPAATSRSVYWGSDERSIMWHSHRSLDQPYNEVYWLHLPTLRPIQVWSPSDKLAAWLIGPDGQYALVAAGRLKTSHGPWRWERYDRKGMKSVIVPSTRYYPLVIVQPGSTPLVVCRRDDSPGRLFLVGMNGRLDRELKLPVKQQAASCISSGPTTFAIAAQVDGGHYVYVYRYVRARWMRYEARFSNPMVLYPCTGSGYVAVYSKRHGRSSAFHLAADGKKTELNSATVQGTHDRIQAWSDCRHLLACEEERASLLDGLTGSIVESHDVRISTSGLARFAPAVGD